MISIAAVMWVMRWMALSGVYPSKGVLMLAITSCELNTFVHINPTCIIMRECQLAAVRK